MPNRPVRVYITGKISGLAEEEFKKNFADAAELLTSHGFTPVNPLDVVPGCGDSCESGLTFEDGSYQHTWQCYMKADIIEMLGCDAVFPLENYLDSRGARTEVGLAITVGMPVIRVRDGELDW